MFICSSCPHNSQYFEGYGWFTGRIDSHEHESRRYHVRYEDGDEDDISDNEEIDKIVRPAQH